MKHLNKGLEVSDAEMFVDEVGEEEGSSSEPEVEGNPLVPQVVNSERR